MGLVMCQGSAVRIQRVERGIGFVFVEKYSRVFKILLEVSAEIAACLTRDLRNEILQVRLWIPRLAKCSAPMTTVWLKLRGTSLLGIALEAFGRL